MSLSQVAVRELYKKIHDLDVEIARVNAALQRENRQLVIASERQQDPKSHPNPVYNGPRFRHGMCYDLNCEQHKFLHDHALNAHGSPLTVVELNKSIKESTELLMVRQGIKAYVQALLPFGSQDVDAEDDDSM
jgi:hypothetical protein